MHATSRRLLLAIAIFAVAMGASMQPAHAGPIEGGELYGVFAQTGSFGTGYNPGVDYTVVRLLDFGPGGDYPGFIQPLSWPSVGNFDPQAPGSGVVPGGEFFLIGNLRGTPGLESDHLLLSVSEADQGTPENFFADIVPQSFHDGLIAGAASRVGAPVVDRLSAESFWNDYASEGVSGEAMADQFFSLDLLEGGPFGGQQSPVVSLSVDSFDFKDGSEDLFGYNPDHDCLCDLIYSWTLSDHEWFAAWATMFYEKLDCTELNDHYAGQIGPSLERPDTFVTRDGTPFVSNVPEPASLVLLGSSLIVGAGVRRRRRRAA